MPAQLLPEKGQFRYYTQTELELMAYMGQVLRFQKKYDEGIALLESVIYNQTQSRVAWIYQWNGLDFVLRVLGGLYFAVGKYEDSNTMKEYAHFTNMQLLEACNLPQTLDAIADNLEHISKRYSEKYKELYRQTYYVADFFACTDIISFTDNYYKENFDADIKWY